MKKKVIVAMSGGVDSSVAAYLLKEEGYDVIGVTMQIWQDDQTEVSSGACCGLSAVEDARMVAEILDIPHYVMNFKDVFKRTVIDYFVEEYQRGKTPNPCIACNRFVKWESMLDKALAMGADYIATGHYAEVAEYPDTGRYCLRAAPSPKDQTYALYNLTQEQLSHTLMPLWNYPKDEVRRIAERIGLCVAHKPDSQEICFIPDNNHGRFIEEYTSTELCGGDFIDSEGNFLGKHKGIANYTIGQRKGLGIALGKPVFVKSIDPVNNTVTLGDNKDLFCRELLVEDINFMALDKLDKPMSAVGKIRYAHKPTPCTISLCEDGRLHCLFDEPQRAKTPGQAAVFYKDGYILCGGTIV